MVTRKLLTTRTGHLSLRLCAYNHVLKFGLERDLNGGTNLKTLVNISVDTRYA